MSTIIDNFKPTITPDMHLNEYVLFDAAQEKIISHFTIICEPVIISIGRRKHAQMTYRKYPQLLVTHGAPL